MSHENVIPEFVQPFDGSQSEIGQRERELVATKFSSFIDDVLLNHADIVTHLNGSSPHDVLHLEAPTGTSNWAAKVEAVTQFTPVADMPLSEQITRSIDVQRLDGIYGRDVFGYRLFADGVVRRWDGGDIQGKKEADRKLGLEPMLRMIEPEEELSIEGVLQVTRNNIEYILNSAIPNQRLERQMGLNEQPVGIDELDGLIDMLSAPTVTAKKLS